MSELRECPERTAHVGAGIALVGTVAVGVAFAVATCGAGTPASVALIGAAFATFASGVGVIGGAIATDAVMDRHEQRAARVSANESLDQNREEAMNASRELRHARESALSTLDSPLISSQPLERAEQRALESSFT